MNVYVVRQYSPFGSYSHVCLVTMDEEELENFVIAWKPQTTDMKLEVSKHPLQGWQKFFRLCGPYKEDVIVNDWELTPVSARVRRKFWR